jgi:hypothetical protein
MITKCSPKIHLHVIPMLHTRGGSVLLVDTTAMAESMNEDKHVSRVITCVCGAIEVGKFKLYIEHPGVRDGHNARINFEGGVR